MRYQMGEGREGSRGLLKTGGHFQTMKSVANIRGSRSRNVPKLPRRTHRRN